MPGMKQRVEEEEEVDEKEEEEEEGDEEEEEEYRRNVDRLEVCETLKKLKIGMTPGMERVCCKMLKYDGETVGK